MSPATKTVKPTLVMMTRHLLAAIPTRHVAESFVCDAVLFWVVTYLQGGIEPAWLIPVMRCILGVDMVVTVFRAYQRQAKTSALPALGEWHSGQPPRT